jgi:hypothetical protein
MKSRLYLVASLVENGEILMEQIAKPAVLAGYLFNGA